MTFEELEREWNLRKRGRRKERLILAALLLFFGVVIAVSVTSFLL